MVHRLGITSLVGVALCVLGCGGSGSSKASSSANSCNIQLSGALSWSYQCYAPPALAENSSPSGAMVEFQAVNFDSNDGIIATVSVILPSEATNKTYQSGDTGFYGDLDVQAVQGWWRALTGDTSEPDSGSVSFTLSAIDGPSQYEGATVRLVHGSAHGTLPAQSGQGSGEVTFDATF